MRGDIIKPLAVLWILLLLFAITGELGDIGRDVRRIATTVECAEVIE